MRLLLAVGMVFMCACGPKDSSDDGSSGGPTSADTTSGGPGGSEGTGGGETATPTDGGASAGSASDAVTGDAATSDGSTTTPGTTVDPSETTSGGACAEFEDAVPSPQVMVSLRNDSAGPVFLFHVSFCEPVQLVEIFESGSDMSFQWMTSACDLTCGQADGGDCGACPPFCPEDQILMIAPGGTHSFAWTGAKIGSVPLTPECGGEDCGPSCLKVSQAGPDNYKLVARASTSAIICADPDVCTCTPNPEGWCDVPASGIGAQLVLAEGALAYPGEQEITLVFTD